jgi:eukaryotic-like serine/threonine-protein kinase
MLFIWALPLVFSVLVSEDPRIGAVLDQRYKIIEQIASGGMGLVYLAERIQLGRTVAIKFLHDWSASDPDKRKRFEVEAQAMARLGHHPNCAGVIDFGVDDQVPYVVMDYVSGETLRSMIDRGPLDIPYALDIMRQVLSGLAHAHKTGIIHRDIKPANIMVGEATGIGVQVKILDFGLAWLSDSAARLTAVGAAIGTPSYMAPEQCSARPLDARTDLYACGVLLFEMLTGQKPFHAADAIDVLEMQVHLQPPRLDMALQRDFGDLEAIVRRVLAKDPAGRFQSASDFRTALEQARYPGGPGGGSRQLPGARRQPWLAPGQRRVVLAAGISALALLAILIAAITGGDSAAPATDSGLVEIDEADEVGEAFELEADLEASVPDLPGVTEVKELLAQGRKQLALRTLMVLRRKHADSAEVHYLLGRLCFDRLWWNDGLEAYNQAIQLDPRYAAYPPLIKSTLEGFIRSPEYHRGMADFLRNEIGDVARPYLEETARAHPKKKTRDRAARELERY